MNCPDGHRSVATDYCDVCGSPMAEPTPVAVVATVPCPSCGSSSSGRFCEVCGHDSALPEPVSNEGLSAESGDRPIGPITWVATVTADREFYERVIARDGPDTDRVGFPAFYPERRIILRSTDILIGKRSISQGLEPDIDLGIAPADAGVSRAHAMIHVAEDGVSVTDLGSTNGTSLNGSDDLIPAKVAVPLSGGDRIHLGGWTTIIISTEPA
ncbi:FHA domain-containing protein [Nocardia australiensis]|uniref:FHA domain-containing protein n=1 Tax=Nocardia australiensis TaxID=2887191 RepID=UPI001D159CD2|nr:FHA domain-containing protein [Nocardia australiensis]